MKIAININFGGFRLSDRVLDVLKMKDIYPENEAFNIESSNDYMYRTHHKLIAAIEKVKSMFSEDSPDIKIINVPDGIDWYISDYDGMETVCEGRRWTGDSL